MSRALQIGIVFTAGAVTGALGTVFGPKGYKKYKAWREARKHRKEEDSTQAETA